MPLVLKTPSSNTTNCAQGTIKCKKPSPKHNISSIYIPHQWIHKYHIYIALSIIEIKLNIYRLDLCLVTWTI